VLKEIDFQKKSWKCIPSNTYVSWYIRRNLLIAFVLPMIALAGYDYLTEK